VDLQIPHCMYCESIFPNAKLKPSKLHEHFDNRCGGVTMENLCELKDTALIPDQHFQ